MAFVLVCGYFVGLIKRFLGLSFCGDTEPITNVLSTIVKSLIYRRSCRRDELNSLLQALPASLFFCLPRLSSHEVCSEPMISTRYLLELCSATKWDFVLNQNWPALVSLFHFGMLLSERWMDFDGSPSYRPSSPLLHLAGHVTLP
jgi:hypothetical protein